MKDSIQIRESSHIEHSEISTIQNTDSHNTRDSQNNTQLHSKADSHNNPKSTNTEPTLIPFSIQGDNPYTIYHVYKSSLYFTNQTKQTDTTNPTTLCNTESKKTIQDTHQDCAMHDFEVYEANANTKHETLQSPNTYNTQLHSKADSHNNTESQKILKSSHIERSEISTMQNQDSQNKTQSQNTDSQKILESTRLQEILKREYKIPLKDSIQIRESSHESRFFLSF